MIRISDVTKSYDDKVAVSHVHLDVAAGSVFGLVGPNGAGKTTLLKMLATLSFPDTGTVEIGGHDVAGRTLAVRSIIGYMPDQFGGYGGLSCDDYLRFFGRAYGQAGTALDARIQDVLDLTDLGGVRDELTTALSTGMKQRLCLAKTLLHDPQVLVLDEPASGLDPRARIEIRALLRELAVMGKTIVISSHILADLEEICSHIGILEEGRLTWAGSIGELSFQDAGTSFNCQLDVDEGDAERSEALLRELDCVAVLRRTGGRIEVVVEGSDANEVLKALIAAGISVRRYEQQKLTLEDLFLQRTRGIVS